MAKTHSPFMILALGLALAFTACKKEDTTAPVVTLIGAASVTVPLGGTYTEPGATATDDVDGDLTAAITIGGSVNEDMAGTYTLTYSVADAAGNSASESRTVSVAPTRDSYLGTFTCAESCQQPYGLATSVTISAGATANQITLSLFYFNGGSLSMTVDGSNVVVDASQNPNPLGEGVTGNGTLNAAGTVLSMNYTFSGSGGGPYSCVATYTRN